MASPMRKKRVWSTPEEDAQTEESAAFEASVAAAKDIAAKSGAFLSIAKEDLTGHQRWLRAQSAAVEKDRRRHERWLQRQHDQEHAELRRERVRRRRRLMRQRALQAVEQAGLDLILFVRSWIVFAFGKIGDGFKFAGLSIASGFSRAGQTIAASLNWTAATFGVAVRMIAASLNRTAAKFGIAIRQAGKGLSAGAAWSKSRARARGASIASTTGHAAAKSGAILVAKLSAGGANAKKSGAILAANLSAGGAIAKQGLCSLSAWTGSRAAAVPPAVYVQVTKFGHKVQEFTRTRAPGAKPTSSAAPAVSPPAASVHVIETYGPHPEGAALFGRPANEHWTPAPLAPEPGVTDPWAVAAGAVDDSEGRALYGPFLEGVSGGSSNERREAQTGSAASLARACGLGARAAILRVKARAVAVSAWAWAGTKTASAWHWAKDATRAGTDALVRTSAAAQKRVRTGDIELSQMMIVAGAVLLVCGGLLVGGGLLMRAGARAPVTADVLPEETFSGITWMFDEPDLPLPERAVFTLSGTPENFLINGLSVSGINNSDQTLTAVEAVLKPDVKRPDLKLSLKVDAPQSPVGDASQGIPSERLASTVLPSGAVPARTSFGLVFPFPPEAMDGGEGLSTEEFFESYGGLFLTLRYQIDGVEKSVFQYLAPDMLKAQLDEVPQQAGGS